MCYCLYSHDINRELIRHLNAPIQLVPDIQIPNHLNTGLFVWTVYKSTNLSRMVWASMSLWPPFFLPYENPLGWTIWCIKTELKIFRSLYCVWWAKSGIWIVTVQENVIGHMIAASLLSVFGFLFKDVTRNFFQADIQI
jgi:hypothetical protein